MRVLMILCLSFFMFACSRNIGIGIDNRQDSNLNNRNDNVPITAIVYKLNDIKKFEDANMLDLLNREDVVLGKDKIDSIRLQVAPNEKVNITNFKSKEVPYIAILVVYTNNENKRNKTYMRVKKIKGIRDRQVKFIITKDGVNFND
ncbi:type VI secretion system lipoprotein TssJ [Helicobacter saguini]|uniref:Type VI secretion system lipoprotein TssJ n=1 Tax=Helicobacter saguini TaxID=1548018 RepID=A0A347W031_9HELI|nr:type VI secretion system lipoprotein TssJ [Helicobacter saguini]MWV62921.1 type VI secretion system lipoprotein TssJ [Helicobacter saguini]MWV66409.1 type VI secretion system lipoprotein TssJ [Helicobacter saguini]MWV68760.1 type VI secretion system lipoprotein TssJ [Helicobacter saguini]MWV71686.1 type VI secretion system lipoprotein TssJ [Helicobacter saguini]TLD91870.1 type VI secretion system lipoprotein TssJ [Helicobacter saguini]